MRPASALEEKVEQAVKIFGEIRAEIGREGSKPSAAYNPVRMLGELIRRERKSQRMTQTQLADLTGLCTPTIVRIEKGDMKASFENVEKTLQVLGKTLWIR